MPDFIENINDPKLKLKLLRSLIRDHLPNENRAFPSELALHLVLSQVKTHVLLSEFVSGPDPNPKLMEGWRVAMDDWVNCLLSLVSSNMPDKCWAGICLLGVTCECCSSERFLASYTHWFQKLISNIQPTSGTHFVKVASCVSLADLFTRLATYPNVKKDATSLAGKLIQPILNFLNEDVSEAVWEGAIDLLCIIISSFPFSVHRHYDNVERVIVSKVMLAKRNTNMSMKYAYCLSILPKVRGDEDSWVLLMQKILLSIHNLLTNVFQGIEEGAKSSDIMRLLVPPGKSPSPPLGGQLFLEESTNMLPGVAIPKVSILMQCCCMMLTNSYSVQVSVPIHHLLALIWRVLLVDGSLCGSLLPYTTAMQQELLCAELPSLHLDSLDLLKAVIKGVRSQLLPHAAHIVRILTEYFKRATSPSVRTRVYSIMQTLLISFGIGMALYLAEEVINNAFVDLIDCPGNEALSSNTNLSKLTCDASKQSGQKKRKHASGSQMEQSTGISIEAEVLNRKMLAPLSVKTAALKALEALLTAGGSLRSECWRSKVDSLLINVATNACDVGWAHEQKHNNLQDESMVSRADFQLAALEALLASILSPSHIRPPYISQGLELFRRGKQETGTKIATFCAHALLTLEILIHPRSLPLIDDAPIAKNSELNDGFNFKNHIGDDHDDDVDDDLCNNWLNDEPTLNDNNANKDMEIENQILNDDAAENNLEDEEMKDNDRGQIMDMHLSNDVRLTNNDDSAPKPIATNNISSYEMETSKKIEVSGNDLNLKKATIDNSQITEAPSNDLHLNKESENITRCSSVMGETQKLSYDSGSTSTDPFPGIVDVDPDSEDVD